MVEALQEMGLTKEEMVKIIAEKFELSEAEAKAKVEKYWDLVGRASLNEDLEAK